VEQSGSVGDGTIGRWCINSDSTLSPLPTALPAHPTVELAALRSHPLTKSLWKWEQATVPLPRAGEFLGLVGQAMNEVIAASPNGRVSQGIQGGVDAAHEHWLADAD